MQAEKLVFQGKKTKKIHAQHKIGKSIMIDSGNMSANNTGVNSSIKTLSSLGNNTCCNSPKFKRIQ